MVLAAILVVLHHRPHLQLTGLVVFVTTETVRAKIAMPLDTKQASIGLRAETTDGLLKVRVTMHIWLDWRGLMANRTKDHLGHRTTVNLRGHGYGSYSHHQLDEAQFPGFFSSEGVFWGNIIVMWDGDYMLGSFLLLPS